jgi:choline dehydrogenase-like flavoprotein
VSEEFDAIVVGSGMSGGWAAKELSERGLKTLVLERGRHIQHGGPEYTDMLAPYERKNYGLYPEDKIASDEGIQNVTYAITPDNEKWFTRFEDAPYTTEEGKPFVWIRAHGLGGRSVLWSRQTYRMSDIDFKANATDGHGVPWPIGYDDMKPWYDHVDRFAGIAGSTEGLEQLPDGVFQPPFDFKAPEKALKERVEKAFPTRNIIHNRCAHLTAPTQEQMDLGRAQCQQRSYCSRGCSFGAYFSSLSATLPAAERTGNMTLVTDAVVTGIVTDPATGKATGVRVVDTNTNEARIYTARVIFLCASALASTQILLNSRDQKSPFGLGNDHDNVGRYIIDHVGGGGARGIMPGFDDRYYEGRAPAGFYVPRFRNVTEPAEDFLRGCGYQCGASREGWDRGGWSAGIGADVKNAMRTPGRWSVGIWGFGEMLPRAENRVTLNRTQKDKWGMPLLHFDVSVSDNERKMSKQAALDAVEMLEAAGCIEIERADWTNRPGERIHEMGGAVMGDDPTTSVTNKYNQVHTAPNVFVTDGACFPSGGCQNPSISYMAMTARAASNAVEMLKENKL